MAGIDTHPSDTDLVITAISFAGAGDNTVIAGVANQKISITKLAILAAGATNITLKSGATSVSGAMPFAANQGMVVDGDRIFFVIPAGSAFVINNSNAVQVSGFVTYTQRLINQG